MIIDEEPDESWAPELLDLEIVIAACYLEAQLGYVRRGELPPAPPAVVPRIGPERPIDDLERLLSYGQVPVRPLHRTVRQIIASHRTAPQSVTPEMVDRLEREADAELRRDLQPVPHAADDYQRRVGALAARPWLAEHARSIPRGWLPICERAVRIGESGIPEPERAASRTMLLTERFSRLEWIVSPRNNRMRTLHLYVLFATRSACMACGAPGDYDTPAKGARSLMLCEEHRRSGAQIGKHSAKPCSPAPRQACRT